MQQKNASLCMVKHHMAPTGKTVAAPRLSEKEKTTRTPIYSRDYLPTESVAPPPAGNGANCCMRVKLDQVSSAKAQMPREPRIQRACRQVPASSFTALKQTLILQSLVKSESEAQGLQAASQGPIVLALVEIESCQERPNSRSSG